MNTHTTKQGIGTKVQLCTMKFMQYMLSAVWWVPLAAYLSHTLIGSVSSLVGISAMAIGAMASSFIGAIADRYFAAEKILAVLNIPEATHPTEPNIRIRGNCSEGVWLMAIVLVRLCVGIWQSMASTTHAIRGTNDVCWAARSKKAPVSIFNTAIRLRNSFRVSVCSVR